MLGVSKYLKNTNYKRFITDLETEIDGWADGLMTNEELESCVKGLVKLYFINPENWETYDEETKS